MTKYKERLETKTEIISGPQKSEGDNQDDTRDTRLTSSWRRERRSVSPEVRTVYS